jgi:polyphosphate kinase 2 (PPK2 family)
MTMARKQAEGKAAKAVRSVAAEGAGAKAKASAGKDKGDTAKGGGKLSNKEYEKQLKKLHVELVKMQEWVKEKGLKVCIVFEGRDGAGKGGTIFRNPCASSSVQKPITRSTPARLYQLRSQITTSPAAGRCGR